MNGDLARCVLPHYHSALSRRPVLTLPFELQQPVLITHHPIFAYHAFFLQPEDLIQLPRRGTLPVIIGILPAGRAKRRLCSAM